MGTLSVADFEASAYKRTQVRRNPNMERKTTLAWVALPKGKEPNAVSAETFANANASTTSYCPLSKTNMERKGGKNTFRKRSPNSSKRFYLFSAR
ncbi:MAG: hypothetical protein J6R08_04705, partial [Opitutales bacterium]|nr:hypothetical protein [Opitutales bacterium]